VRLDLRTLRDRHPRLLPETAAILAVNAAVALERRHGPGVEASLRAFGAESVATIDWEPATERAPLMLDANDVTELGAEALALAAVHETRGWVARRRLQHGEYADWLMTLPDGSVAALEISGTDEGDHEVRMRQKLLQVAKCVVGKTLAACVVSFLEPSISAREAPSVLL
jgi:hypothetical protein